MDEYQTTVPAIVYENEMARHERAEKKLLIILLITIVLSIASVFAVDYGWRCFISEYDIQNYDCDQDGNVNIVGNENGVENNGAEGTHKNDD